MVRIPGAIVPPPVRHLNRWTHRFPGLGFWRPLASPSRHPGASMTQVQPDRSPAPDALSVPFTPGSPANPAELADFPETLAGPVPVPLAEPRTRAFVEQWRNASY